MFIKRIILIASIFIVHSVKAQEIPIATSHGVYLFLDQMALQYEFPWNDLMKPVSQGEVIIALEKLNAQKVNLTIQQQKELYFYRQAFSKFNHLNNIDTNYKKNNLLSFINKWTEIGYEENKNKIDLRPLIGTTISNYQGSTILERNIGATLSGSFENKFDYFFSYRDISIDGNGIKNIPSIGAPLKYVNVGDVTNAKSKNYNELRASLAYHFKNGVVSIGQDRFSWGYGQDAQIVLSQNAPAYPNIKLKYNPFKWIQFNYMHAWLQSSLVDSAQTYSYNTTTYGGYHQQYKPKFFAIHSITFIPKTGIELSIGESIVYTNQLNPGYLIPIMYFKSFDNTSSNQNILAGDNGQMFLGFSLRRWIPQTQLYGQLFIDEIRLTKMFSTENRNQLGYQLGIKKANWFGNEKWVMGAEYTRNRPFIYTNINPILNYTHHDQNLGDWMGNNADRTVLYAQYTPAPKLFAKISYEIIRKGGAGTIDDQYLANPQPPFLFDPLFTQKSMNLEVRYQWLRNIHLQLLTSFTSLNKLPSNSWTNANYMQAGLYMGLY